MKKRVLCLLLTLVMGCAFAVPIGVAADSLCWPVPGHNSLSQGYHEGNAIDISDGSIGGATIVAAKSGTVKSIYNCSIQHYGSFNYNGCNCSGFGTGVVIVGTDGRAYQYAHMRAGSIPSNVYVGASVTAGQSIGQVGTTGNSTGNHLHFGISYSKNYWEAGPNPDPQAGYVSYYDHTHTYSNYVCTKCGAWNESSLKSKSSVNLTFAATGSGIVRSGPYSGCSKIKTLSEGTIINATQKVTNAEGNVWYKLSDGGYIYSGNVKTAPAGTVNIYGLTANSITTTGAKVVCTMQASGLATSAVTEVGVKIWNSSFSKSACDRTINWTTSNSTTVFYYTVTDCGISLNPGTTCYYQFYAIVSDGRRIESETKSFVTSGGHSHSYGSAWKYDGTNHWHECSCGAKSSTAAHSYGSWVTTTAATHTSAGSKYRTCSVCGYKQTQSISATGHSYGTAWKSDGSNHWHECSCGAKSGTAAHSYGSWITTSAATHTTAGSKYRTCSVCGYKQTQSISATGHSYDKQNTNAKYLKSAATCTEPAVYYYSCSCGEKGSKTFTYGDALGHSFSLGTCTVCGAADPDYNPGGGGSSGGSSGGFFSSLLNSIRSIFHDLFSWLPFC